MSAEQDNNESKDVGNSTEPTPDESQAPTILGLLTDAQMNSSQLGTRVFNFVRSIGDVKCDDLRAQLLQAVDALAEKADLWRVQDQPVVELPSGINSADDYGLICYLLQAARKGEPNIKFIAAGTTIALRKCDEDRVRAESLAVPFALATAQSQVSVSRSAAHNRTTLEASPDNTTVAMASMSSAKEESLDEVTSLTFDTPGSKMPTTPRGVTPGSVSDTERVNQDKLRRMSQTEQAQYMSAYNKTEEAISDVCQTIHGPTTPVALSPNDLRNLLSDIKKQSEDICGTKKTRKSAHTQFGVLQTILHIMKQANASNGVLIDVLNHSSTHEQFLQKYSRGSCRQGVPREARAVGGCGTLFSEFCIDRQRIT